VLAVTLALEKAVWSVAEQRGETPKSEFTLADLVHGGADEYVALTDAFDISAALLAEVCRGRIFKLYGGTWRHRLRHAPASAVQAMLEGDADSILARSGLSENRLARRLNISRNILAATSYSLWQKTFSEKRDELAGTDANQQKRGQVARALQAELEKALADGND
jgi:hypothetical protein